jgi:SAM-dependent methyltransferase
MNQPDVIERFTHETVASLTDGTFVRLVLSPAATEQDAPRKILGRLVQLKGAPHLSLTFRHDTRDTTRNLPLAASADWLREQLRHGVRSALLGTTKADWQVIQTEAGPPRLISHKPARKQAPPREHDQKHGGLLGASARDWLQGLGVLDRDGKLRASMADKFRQINRYVELLSHLAKECGWGGDNIQYPTSNTEPRTSQFCDDGGAESQIPNRKSQIAVTLADMGCGKGYLTFGAWHLFHRVWKRPARIIGVEVRPELAAAASRVARQARADGLEFVPGDIRSANLPPVDALIALHACNTATDDAIRRGIELGAKLIVVAPCCHKELRPQLGRPEPLAAILRHGVMEERLAEWLTDGLRALFLEWAGYDTKLMEFVASEHTPKNLMLAAIRRREPFTDTAARQRIAELKAWFGIQHHALDGLLSGLEPLACG